MHIMEFLHCLNIIHALIHCPRNLPHLPHVALHFCAKPKSKISNLQKPAFFTLLHMSPLSKSLQSSYDIFTIRSWVYIDKNCSVHLHSFIILKFLPSFLQKPLFVSLGSSVHFKPSSQGCIISLQYVSSPIRS